MLAGNTSTTKCFVQETGTGSAAQAPTCSALVSGDIPNNTANTTGNAATATTATNFSGSLAGDVTGTQGATSVVKVNGAAVPVSTGVLGSNGSGQLIASTTGLPAGTQLTLSISSAAIADLASGPTITQGGTPGSNNYVYGVVARNTAGTIYTAISPLTTTTTGAATLNATNNNIITFPSLPTNANCFDVYRIMDSRSSGGSNGLIASCQTASSYTDTGGSASGLEPFYASWRPQTTGLPAGCLQYPCVVASGVQTGLTATNSGSTNNILLYTTPSGGSTVYRICGSITMTSAATAGTYAMTPVFTFQSHTYNSVGLAHNTTASTAYYDTAGSTGTANCTEFNADASSNIQTYASSSSVTGSPVWVWQYLLERLR
jgi:hypothetical protein